MLAKTEKNKVMIVDDDKTFLEELKDMLSFTLNNCDIITTHDPACCVEKASSDLPDLILIDVNMPHKDAFQVARELEENANLRDIPVFVMSVSFTDDFKSPCRTRNIKDIIKKPLDIFDMVRKIDKILKLN